MPNVEERMRSGHGGESQANQPTNNQNDDSGPAQESLSFPSRVIIADTWVRFRQRVLPVKGVNC